MAGSEIDALRIIDEALSSLNDPAARERVLAWACAKYTPGGQLPVAPSLPPSVADVESKTTATKSRPKAAATGRKRTKYTPAIVRDLNLKPADKKSFRDFVAEKAPDSNQERSVVALYYLRHIISIDPVTVDHIFTCFKDASWRVPANLQNALQVIASLKGWIDTRNMKDLRLTTLGENLIEHDLPPRRKAAKKS